MIIFENELLQCLNDPSEALTLDLRDLTIIDATPEGLSEVIAEIRKLGLGPNILRLNLSNNSLTYLPEGLFFQGLTALRVLYLYGNQLSRLPEDLFQGLTALQQLYLPGNRLSRLPEGLFRGLTALQELYLEGNRLSDLPERLFQGPTALREIHLSGNRLSSLPEGLFKGLSALQELYLSRNQLSRLPEGLFQGLTALRQLYLSNNRLSIFPLRLLENLNLAQNYPRLADNFNFGPEGEIQMLAGIKTPDVGVVFRRIMAEHEDNLDVLNRALDNTYPDLTFSDEQIKTLEEAKTRALEQKTMLFQCLDEQGVPEGIGNIILSLTGHHHPKPKPK